MADIKFTTVRRRDIFDALVEAYDAAKVAAASNASWSSALDGAYGFALEAEEFQYNVEHWAVHVPSATRAGKSYTSNGDCQCEAFTRGKGICWHRALARLLRRALEPELVSVAADWDAGVAEQRAALGARIGAAQAAKIQAEVDELFPAR